MVKRLKFNSWTQKLSESIATFVAYLRMLAKHFKFQATLNDTLRFKLVYDVIAGCLQCCLLTEPKLILKDIVIIAIIEEHAEKGAQQLQQQQQHQSLTQHKVGQTNNSHVDHLQTNPYAINEVIIIIDHQSVV